MTEATSIGLISAGAALAGALIGGAATALATWIQQRAESRRALVRLAAEIELEEVKAVLQVVANGTDVKLGNSMQAIIDRYNALRELSENGPESEQLKQIVARIPRRTGTVDKPASFPAKK
jgi:hypothetical protein